MADDGIVDLYLRKSNKDGGRSVARQLDELTTTAGDEGLTIGLTFVDPDLSASRFARKDRPDYAALLEHIRSGRCRVLGLLEASRGSRSLTEWSTFLDLCRAEKVKIWIATHEKIYDLSRRRDWKALADEGVLAANESEQLSERVQSGKRKAARAGTPAGRLQFGFTRVYNEKGEFVEQVAHPTEAPIVAEMVRRIATGDSLFQIARDLNERGVTMPGGSPWRGPLVRQMVLRPSYAGRRVHHGEDVGPATWQPIVDVDQWRRAVAILTRPERRSTTRGTALAHWLTNAVTCGACRSAKLTARTGGRARPRLTYLCRCGVNVVSGRALEGVVERLLLARLAEPDALEVFRPRSDSRALDAAEKELQELNDHLEEHYAEARARRLSARGLAAVEAPLLADIERARAKVRRLSVPADLADLDPAEVIKGWPDFPPQTKRRYLLALAEVVVAPAVRRGPVFDVRRLDASRWAGDDRTWGEIYALARVAQ
ncbi:MAG TPA: recombinase family protein [Actinoplanes sp.]|jgi:DNA invertase Pin-like site-specific DNA recombinase|nr:recombinase family protein [Actinoplanes sp.]